MKNLFRTALLLALVSLLLMGCASTKSQYRITYEQNISEIAHAESTGVITKEQGDDLRASWQCSKNMAVIAKLW